MVLLSLCHWTFRYYFHFPDEKRLEVTGYLLEEYLIETVMLDTNTRISNGRL